MTAGREMESVSEPPSTSRDTLALPSTTSILEAKVACGATTDTDVVRLGLEALVRLAAYERLRALRGSEIDAVDVPRRRERISAKRIA